MDDNFTTREHAEMLEFEICSAMAQYAELARGDRIGTKETTRNLVSAAAAFGKILEKLENHHG